jgi:transposase-like protein
VKVVPDCSRKTLRPTIKGQVLSKSTVYTDGWASYDGLVLDGDHHHRIHHHENQFARGKTHLNGIESFWSFAKTRMAKMRGLHQEHFLAHLLESQWRWNHRKDNTDQLLLKFIPLCPLSEERPNQKMRNNHNELAHMGRCPGLVYIAGPLALRTGPLPSEPGSVPDLLTIAITPGTHPSRPAGGHRQSPRRGQCARHTKLVCSLRPCFYTIYEKKTYGCRFKCSRRPRMLAVEQKQVVKLVASRERQPAVIGAILG